MGGRFDMHNVTIDKCSAEYGGGFYVEDDVMITEMSDILIHDCSAVGTNHIMLCHLATAVLT